MNRFLPYILLLFIFEGCKSEKDKLEEKIEEKVKLIDFNRRVEIIEDDFKDEGVIYKIRAYVVDGVLLKIISVANSTAFEKDDYFYFENGEIIFSGHLYNDKSHSQASEYKYYYADGKIDHCMYWTDHYKPHKPFPHESFEPYYPDMDSLMNLERSRLAYFRQKLDIEGFQLKEEDENALVNSD